MIPKVHLTRTVTQVKPSPNGPTSIVFKLCSTLKDADLAREDTSAVCFPNTIDCLSILALSPLTFAHSEISTLLNVKIAHNIPNSQVKQEGIEMRNTQEGFLLSLNEKLQMQLLCLRTERLGRAGYL